MDNKKQNIVQKIAQELDAGFDCYYNSKTAEVIGIPSFSDFFDDEDFKEAFSDSLEKIKKHSSDFIKFKALESFESFEIMEGFVEQVPDKNLKAALENILKRKKPFQNFKHKIDFSDFRQNWFDYKQIALEKIVENRLQ
ncbi:UPF0158 family protein [Polaribacter sp.]|uniref:UPF0158 family protein n=1 Tax=Polaribacter sp. TaxID=1920175 RepID=UPI003EF625D1